ncbi:MAG: GNAT family N-acetyltransferase [Bacteroidetes bacterium]|nr:GNAT family N-acetyltransferase [Bacteroidota bacterium]
MHLHSQSKLTYFSSLEWHQVVLGFYRNTFLTKKINKLIYFTVSLNSNPEIKILGFFYISIKKEGRVINFSHLLGPSDYYDFVSEDTISAIMITNVIKQIQKDFKVTEIRFAHIKATSKIIDAIIDIGDFNKTALDCVAINLPGDYEIYLQSLSKSVKQNLRTAYNRMQKNNIELKLIVQGKDNYESIDFNVLKNKYQERNAYRKEKLIWKSRIFKKVDCLFSKELDMFDFEQIKNTDFTLAILEFNGELAAYFFGFKRLNKIEINRVVINDMFKFYSPGMLLLNEFIKEGIKEKLEIIDLTVGDEKYKYDLGGKTHEIFNINGNTL